MPLLTEGLLPQLTSEVISKLKDFDVLTVEDLLFTKKRHLLANILDKEFAEEILIGLEENYAAPLRSALEVFQELCESINTFSTGCTELDALLGGGIFTGELVELVGPEASGKTQLCMMAALEVVRHSIGGKPSGFTVLYLDTHNAFSPARIAQLFRSRSVAPTTTAADDSSQPKSRTPRDTGHDRMAVVDAEENATGDPVDESEVTLEPALRRIMVMKVYSALALFNVLERVSMMLERREDPVIGDKLKLVVVDSIGTLLSAQVMGTRQHTGRGLMIEISRVMKAIATKHNVAFLMTNYVVRRNDDPNAPVRPGLGDVWSSIPNTQILLRQDGVTSAAPGGPAGAGPSFARAHVQRRPPQSSSAPSSIASSVVSQLIPAAALAASATAQNNPTSPRRGPTALAPDGRYLVAQLTKSSHNETNRGMPFLITAAGIVCVGEGGQDAR